MRRLILILLSLLLLTGCSGAPGVKETTLTAVGQPAPDFTVPTLDGGTFTLSEQRGKVVLINWFATWCPPCREEMPHLQKEVWEKFEGDDFAMVSVAREEAADVVAPFVAKYAVSWPFVLDLDRAAYALYAQAYIPRNHVIDKEGRIIFQSSGFEKPEFAEMIEVIQRELDR